MVTKVIVCFCFFFFKDKCQEFWQNVILQQNLFDILPFLVIFLKLSISWNSLCSSPSPPYILLVIT